MLEFKPNYLSDWCLYVVRVEQSIHLLGVWCLLVSAAGDAVPVPLPLVAKLQQLVAAGELQLPTPTLQLCMILVAKM